MRSGKALQICRAQTDHVLSAGSCGHSRLLGMSGALCGRAASSPRTSVALLLQPLFSALHLFLEPAQLALLILKEALLLSEGSLRLTRLLLHRGRLLLDAKRGVGLGLTDDEVAFYDALAANESAVMAMGDDKLKVIAAELITMVRQSVTIYWTFRESARAKIKVMVKRVLNKYGYPPDLQEEAVKTVLRQAELLCAEWTGCGQSAPSPGRKTPFAQPVAPMPRSSAQVRRGPESLRQWHG